MKIGLLGKCIILIKHRQKCQAKLLRPCRGHDRQFSEKTQAEYPIVLNIIGDCLSQEEKKTIAETIKDDFAYNLGMVEKTEKRHTKVFCLMTIGLILSGAMLWYAKNMADEPRELLYLLFWFMGENLCDYLFLTGYELRRDRRQAGRLASIKVIFCDSYQDPHYTDDDVEKAVFRN